MKPWNLFFNVTHKVKPHNVRLTMVSPFCTIPALSVSSFHFQNMRDCSFFLTRTLPYKIRILTYFTKWIIMKRNDGKGSNSGTKSSILFLYGKKRIRKRPYSGKFYPVYTDIATEWYEMSYKFFPHW